MVSMRDQRLHENIVLLYRSSITGGLLTLPDHLTMIVVADGVLLVLPLGEFLTEVFLAGVLSLGPHSCMTLAGL